MEGIVNRHFKAGSVKVTRASEPRAAGESTGLVWVLQASVQEPTSLRGYTGAKMLHESTEYPESHKT